MSRIDFTPAETTATSVWLSSVRSAETSIESLGAAVHATEAAGDEDADAGQRGQAHRARDRRRAVPLRRHDVREVAQAHLGDVLVRGEQLELVGGEADARDTVEDGDRRGGRAAVADDLLDLAGHLDVARGRACRG